MTADVPRADETAARHRIEGTCLYLLGSFDRSVTVLGQQNRALNLAWALIDSGEIPAEGSPKRIAIIGAGFAGMTFAAALLKKQMPVQITIFEERDTLLPLQQGSDTRWLHPNIYNWPRPGSTASVAMLPVLNWTAARASDVVVQVLDEWRELIRDLNVCEPPTLYCNTRHLQVLPIGDSARIEFVGEARQCSDGSAITESSSTGSSEEFDLVVLAIGFGAERKNQLSYWRNETYAQPSLSEQRRTFLISGQGDGAMIDLLRIRISQYRQDRILDELFHDKSAVIERLKVLERERYAPGSENLFRRFESLMAGSGPASKEMQRAREILNTRLRRDTEAFLRLEVQNLEGLFMADTSRTSFQNALLVYLLYRCGGFAPSNEPERVLQKRYGIAKDNIIYRHGTDRDKQLQRLIPKQLFEQLKPKIDDSESEELRQSSDRLWPGGFLGFPGPTSRMDSIKDSARQSWRKEYLPGPTELAAEAICGALAGWIRTIKPETKHFRLTLHRSLPLHEEELLQQACDYAGDGIAPDEKEKTSARIYPTKSGTIGLAYRSRRIVRTRRGVSKSDLNSAMAKLELHSAARRNSKARFLLVIPFLQPADKFVGKNSVVGTFYLDSQDEGFWIDDKGVQDLAALLQKSLADVLDKRKRRRRVDNVELAELRSDSPVPEAMDSDVEGSLEFVGVTPPTSNSPHSFNFDYNDAMPRIESET